MLGSRPRGSTNGWMHSTETQRTVDKDAVIVQDIPLDISMKGSFIGLIPALQTTPCSYVIYDWAVRLLASDFTQAEYVTPAFDSKWKYEKLAAVVLVFQNTQNLVVVYLT